MTEENEKERVPESAYFGRLGRAGPAGGPAPSGIVGGLTGVGVFACLIGVAALVLAALPREGRGLQGPRRRRDRPARRPDPCLPRVGAGS